MSRGTVPYLETQGLRIWFRTWRLSVSGYGSVPGDSGSPGTISYLETLSTGNESGINMDYGSW